MTSENELNTPETSPAGDDSNAPKRKSSTYWRGHRMPGWLRAIAGRWWWVVVPLIGIVCAEAYVNPYVADSENDINKILKFKSDRMQQLQAEYGTAESELYAVEQTIDTLFVPELEWHDRQLDSLQTVRQDIESSFPLLERQIGTLNEQLLALEDPLNESSQLKVQRGTEIQMHRDNIGTLRDSLQTLILEQEALDDRLDRLENPDKYDRSRGLISPGQ